MLENRGHFSPPDLTFVPGTLVAFEHPRDIETLKRYGIILGHVEVCQVVLEISLRLAQIGMHFAILYAEAPSYLTHAVSVITTTAQVPVDRDFQINPTATQHAHQSREQN